MKRRARRIAMLVMLGSLAVATNAFGDDRSPSDAGSTTEQRRVLLVVAASAEDGAALDASLRELLTRIGVVLDVRRVERLELENPASIEHLDHEGAGLAVIYVDLRGDSDPAVAIADGHTGRALLYRRVEKHGSAAMAIETVAHVVQSAVEELTNVEKRAAAAAPVQHAEPPVVQIAPAPTPQPDRVVPVEAPKKGWALDLGGFFGGRIFGGGSNVVVGGGAAATLSPRRGQWRPAALFIAEYHVAFEVPGDLVSVHAQVLSLRLIPTIQLAGGASWLLEAGFGGGVDAFFTSPRSTDLPPALLSPSRTDASPVLTALVAAHVAVARSADLILAVTLDGDLAPNRYVAADGAVNQAIFAPQRFRPALMVGFTFAALGPVPYPMTGAGR